MAGELLTCTDTGELLDYIRRSDNFMDRIQRLKGLAN